MGREIKLTWKRNLRHTKLPKLLCHKGCSALHDLQSGVERVVANVSVRRIVEMNDLVELKMACLRDAGKTIILVREFPSGGKACGLLIRDGAVQVHLSYGRLERKPQ